MSDKKFKAGELAFEIRTQSLVRCGRISEEEIDVGKYGKRVQKLCEVEFQNDSPVEFRGQKAPIHVFYLKRFVPC